ncbi:hypothetical protein [Neisseria sicca]|nr:hypothetical protein [Neisseria sicca]
MKIPMPSCRDGQHGGRTGGRLKAGWCFQTTSLYKMATSST